VSYDGPSGPNTVTETPPESRRRLEGRMNTPPSPSNLKCEALFKTIHEVYRIGAFWSHIQARAPREFCTTCGSTESMEHILIDCRSQPVRQIWNLAKNIWPHRDIPWPEISLGTILGCGCLSAHQTANPREINRDQRPNALLKGATRLLQILISESAHLIWVLRCERVIRQHIHNNQEIRSRWRNKLETHRR
jgi:hypothetical protein